MPCSAARSSTVRRRQSLADGVNAGISGSSAAHNSLLIFRLAMPPWIWRIRLDGQVVLATLSHRTSVADPERSFGTRPAQRLLLEVYRSLREYRGSLLFNPMISELIVGHAIGRRVSLDGRKMNGIVVYNSVRVDIGRGSALRDD